MSENIGEMIERICLESGRCTPEEPDPDLWGDYEYDYEVRGLKLSQFHSCDGIIVNRVFYRGKLVYKDDSYDNSIPEVQVYRKGEWEVSLRELYTNLP